MRSCRPGQVDFGLDIVSPQLVGSSLCINALLPIRVPIARSPRRGAGGSRIPAADAESRALRDVAADALDRDEPSLFVEDGRIAMLDADDAVLDDIADVTVGAWNTRRAPPSRIG